MSNRKLNIVAVDDFPVELEEIFDELNNSLLKDQFVMHQCQFVEEVPAKYEGLITGTAMQLIENFKAKKESIDLVLLDRGFEEEFQTDIDIGPRKVIAAIQEFCPQCKVLLLSKKGGYARDTHAGIKGLPNQQFRTIGKNEPSLAVLVIYDLMKDWSLGFLHANRSKIDKDRISNKVRNKQSDLPEIKINGDIWHPNTYLMPYYLYLQNPSNPDSAAIKPAEVLEILQESYHPKLTAWHTVTHNYRYPLAKYYEKYKEWPERSKAKLNKAAIKFIREYMHAEKNRAAPPVNQYNWKGDIQFSIDDFDFVPQLETVLLGRRIAIGLYLLGYIPDAIWFALQKQPEVYSLLSENEKSRANPNKFFPTYYALSLKNDLPKNADSFDSYKNLLIEEIEWLNETFDLSIDDIEAVNIFVDDMKSILDGVSNHPSITNKQRIISHVEAESVIRMIITILRQESQLGYFLENVHEEIAALNGSSNLKKFLTKIISDSSPHL